jgi:arabinogalactan endo-1,4-beta-galactosidase
MRLSLGGAEGFGLMKNTKIMVGVGAACRPLIVGLSASLIFASGSAAAHDACEDEPLTVLNASFDKDGTGVASPAGWVSRGSIAADFTETGGRTGTFRLTHWGSGAYSVDTSQTLGGARRGNWYTLRGFARRSAGANNSYMQLACGRESRRVEVPVAWWDQWLELAVSVEADSASCTITLHTDAAGGEWTSFDDIQIVPGAAKLDVLGADVSSLTKSEDFGGVYRDERGRRGDALKILEDRGMSHVRLRVWVNPADGYHDRDEAAQIAKRAKRLGLKTLVDFHYSDRWADPGQQTKPAAWAGYSVSELANAVYEHTYAVCKSMVRSGEAPDMIQIGNELNSGMLWPDGHTWDPPNWDNLALFLQAGADAVRACSRRTKVVLHLANGGDNGLYRWWFDNVTARFDDFDVIAASYYGYWHGSLGDLQRNLIDVSQRYDKDVFVAETAYPFTLGFDDNHANIIGLPGQLVAGYAPTPQGQAANFRDVLSIVRAIPGGRGLGAFYWDATWTAVPGNGWDPEDPASGNAWENQAMFDFNDRALPVMSEFRR